MCVHLQGTSLYDRHPSLASQWHPTKNKPLTPQQVALNYSKKVWWQCPTNPEHEWDASPNARNSSQTGCPYCAGTKAWKDNNFAVLFPTLLKEWNWKRNEGCNPFELLSRTHRVVWWKCEKGHEWDEKISSRTDPRRNATCPYCSGSRIGEDNHLGVLRPDVAKFWDHRKNKKITPEKVAPYSNKDYHWTCGKHEWKTSPALFGSCPYCGNRKVDDTNSLTVLYPYVAKEWHPTKNDHSLPNAVIPGSPKRAWWKCSTCNHEWQNSIRNRSQRGQGCPECNKWNGTSFAEQSLFHYIKKVFPHAQNRFAYDAGKKKIELDIYIPEVNIAIEYDGYRFHKTKRKMKIDHEKNLLLKGNVQLIRIREKGLPPLPDEGSISFTRTSNQREKLSECIEFVINYLLSLSAITPQQKTILSSLSIDVIQDAIAIYEYMNLQEIEHSVGHTHPHLVPYWNAEKNGTLSPFKLRATNQTEVAWRCEHDHEWSESIYRVSSRSFVCHTCASFGFHYPELLQKWDYDKNKKINPFVIRSGSKKEVWWIDEKGNSYRRSIGKETRCIRNSTQKSLPIQIVSIPQPSTLAVSSLS